MNETYFQKIIPQEIEGFKLEKPIGRGSSSVIFLAKEIHTNQYFAIKVIPRQMLIDHSQVDQFQSEITILSKLNHPNITRFYGLMCDETYIYVVLEYCAYGDLRRFVEKNGSLSEKDAKIFIKQILAAVGFIHELGIAHRDIKLDNILIDHNFRIKLGDFGLCMDCSKEGIAKDKCGSPYYAAPEILMRNEYDPLKADMWALGVVIFILTTGTYPWTMTKDKAQLYYEIQCCRYHIPDHYSLLLKNLIQSLMHPLPDMRPDSKQLYEHPWLNEGGNVPSPFFMSAASSIVKQINTQSMINSNTNKFVKRKNKQKSLIMRKVLIANRTPMFNREFNTKSMVC